MPSRRIVLIDPDYHRAGELAEFLRTQQMDVHYANDTRQGLWLAGTQAPDAILLSLNFPDGLGVQAVESLRNDPDLSRIPLVVLAHKAAWEAHGAAVRLMADEWLLTPWDADDLLRRLENLVGFGGDGTSDAEIETTVERLIAEDAPEVAELVREIQRIEEEETAERELRALAPVPTAAGVEPVADATPDDTIRRLAGELEDLREHMSIMASAHAVDMQNMMAERQSLFDKAQKLGRRVRELEAALTTCRRAIDTIRPPATETENDR